MTTAEKLAHSELEMAGVVGLDMPYEPQPGKAHPSLKDAEPPSFFTAVFFPNLQVLRLLFGKWRRYSTQPKVS
jgi:hypothetical protein